MHNVSVDTLGEITQHLHRRQYADALACLMRFRDKSTGDRQFFIIYISFALRQWSQLAKLHQPAQDELVNYRNRIASDIINSVASFEQFQELVAVNVALCDEQATGRLFVALDGVNNRLAGQCYNLAENGLYRCAYYDVCSRHIADARARYQDIRSRHQFALATPPPGDVEGGYQDMADDVFCNDVFRLLFILRATGRDNEADDIKRLVLSDVIESPLCNRIDAI